MDEGGIEVIVEAEAGVGVVTEEDAGEATVEAEAEAEIGGVEIGNEEGIAVVAEVQEGIAVEAEREVVVAVQVEAAAAAQVLIRALLEAGHEVGPEIGTGEGQALVPPGILHVRAGPLGNDLKKVPPNLLAPHHLMTLAPKPNQMTMVTPTHRNANTRAH